MSGSWEQTAPIEGIEKECNMSSLLTNILKWSFTYISDLRIMAMTRSMPCNDLWCLSSKCVLAPLSHCCDRWAHEPPVFMNDSSHGKSGVTSGVLANCELFDVQQLPYLCPQLSSRGWLCPLRVLRMPVLENSSPFLLKRITSALWLLWRSVCLNNF